MDRLGDWFSEAQASLSTVKPICSEANTLVRTSRKQIEHATMLWAQVIFLYDSIGDQLSLLQNVTDALWKGHNRAKVQANDAVVELKSNQHKLLASLDTLKASRLDPAFKPQAQTEGGPPPVSLRSFVHEEGIHNLLDASDMAIESIRAVQKSLTDTITECTNEMKRIRTNMSSAARVQKKSLHQANQGTDSVAEHAYAMARLLESLARHYDQCQKAVQMGHDQSGLPPEELDELLGVLEHDSQEVDGVVQELNGQYGSIKSSEKIVTSFHSQMQSAHNDMLRHFDQLDKFTSETLPKYLVKIDGFSKGQKDRVEDVYRLVQEVASLNDYYGLFVRSYHALVLEVHRRRKAQAKIEAIATDMATTLKKLHQEELGRRKDFIDVHGDYLPSDLWTGLTEIPNEPSIDYQLDDLPRVSNSALDEARSAS